MAEPAHYLFAGGGTGGHLYPGLAVAHALLQRDPSARITFFTTTRSLDAELLDRTPHARVPQPVRPLSLRPWRWPAFLTAWRQSVAAAGDFLRQNSPRAVLGLGGYAAGPPVVAGHRLGVRTAILNPDAVPGRANRVLAGYADLVVMQWEFSRSYFKRHTDARTLGCPIRAAFAGVERGQGIRRFELDPGRLTVLVTGASQGARSINQTLPLVWPQFVSVHPDWQILHLAGAADEAETRAAYERAGTPARVLAFTHEMPLALAAADVVIARAGASTLAELTALGRPSILLPYPYHRDRHQHVNAQVLVDAGAAILIDDARDPAANRAPLLAALERLTDPTTRTFMASAAQRLGRPRAAADVAAWLCG